MIPNGAKSLITTIRKLIRDTGSSIISMQETKATHASLNNLDGYFTYEQIRSKKDGGGVTISALKTLQPVFVSEGGEDAEAVTIDKHVKQMAVTITSAYGPQESAKNNI